MPTRRNLYPREGDMDFYGEDNGTPLQYSRLENPMGGGDWWAAVHGVSRVRHDLATKQLLLLD